MTDISRHFGQRAGSSRIRVRIAVPDLNFWSAASPVMDATEQPKEDKAELLALFKSDLRSLKEQRQRKSKLSDLPRSARIRAALAG